MRGAEETRVMTERAGIVFDEWSTHETYGYQKMSKHLKKHGYEWAGEKCVRLLYERLGLRGLRSAFKTTRAGKAPYGKFPYLLMNKAIRFPNQVMATDITYIKTPWGMMYFTAVIDLFSRKILSWRLSGSMSVDFCLECVLREPVHERGLRGAAAVIWCGNKHGRCRKVQGQHLRRAHVDDAEV